MKFNFNFDALSPLTEAEKAISVFGQIKSALAMLPMAIDCVGETAAVKMSAVRPDLIAGRDVEVPSVERIAAYLVGDKAAKFFGRKWAVPADTPAALQYAGRLQEFYRDNLRDLDLGWQPLFRFIEQRTSTNDSIDIVNSSTAIGFELAANGSQIKINRNVSANSTVLRMLTYTGGVSFFDDWFRFNKWYQVQEAVEDLFNAYAKMEADAHYGLITAVGSGSNVAFDIDDQTTFNKAVAGMLRALEVKGYAVSGNVEVDILCAPERIGRILAMLDATRGSVMVAYGTADQPIAFGVRNVIPTMRIGGSEANYYIVLPERKIRRAVWKDLTIESKRAEDYRATDWYAHAQFNAGVGEQDQVRRVALQ